MKLPKCISLVFLLEVTITLNFILVSSLLFLTVCPRTGRVFNLNVRDSHFALLCLSFSSKVYVFVIQSHLKLLTVRQISFSTYSSFSLNRKLQRAGSQAQHLLLHAIGGLAHSVPSVQRALTVPGKPPGPPVLPSVSGPPYFVLSFPKSKREADLREHMGSETHNERNCGPGVLMFLFLSEI